MRSAETGALLQGHAERGGVIYDFSRPSEQIASGALLELIDFRNAARDIGLSIGIGTSVFKQSIMHLSGPHPWVRNDCPQLDPFCNSWRLPGDRSFEIFHEIPVVIKLTDYYIGSQVFKDLIDNTDEKSGTEPFGTKSFLVARAVVYDDGEIEEARGRLQ